jgi:hypothetical protein
MRTRMLPEMHSASVTRCSIAQLRRVMPRQCVFGLYKSRFRASVCGDMQQSACRVHLDDVRLTEHDVRLALFPIVDETAPLATGREAVLLPGPLYFIWVIPNETELRGVHENVGMVHG